MSTAIAVKERPILMHARSIRGITEGRKTQTRRIIKPGRHNLSDLNSKHVRNIRAVDGGIQCDWLDGVYSIPLRCPYGKPGDRLWVRETWQEYRENSTAQQEAISKSITRIQRGEAKDIVAEVMNWSFGAGERHILYAADFGERAYDVDSDLKPWRPSIFMPRWACRLVLEITDIRVERVQDISYRDVIAEGLTEWLTDEQQTDAGHKYEARQAFAQLWDDTNGKGAWDRNDWCWVISFKKVVVVGRFQCCSLCRATLPLAAEGLPQCCNQSFPGHFHGIHL